MTDTVVELSSGDKIEVKRLGIFELDALDPDPVGPFVYIGSTLAGEVQIEYDGSQWEAPPQKPDVDDPKEGSPEWYELREYEAYQAWELHEKRRMAEAAQYHNRIAEYILDHCLNGDRDKLVTPEDWEAVHTAALVPQLTQEDVAEALRNTFPGYV